MLDWISKEFLIAVCGSLAIAVISLWVSPYQTYQTPGIEAKQQADSGKKGQENSDETKSPINARGNHNAEHGGDEASEYWTLLGRKLKITDTLLVLFTFTLWWSTNGLVKEAKESSTRQLRAYVHPSTPQIEWKAFNRSGAPWGNDTGWVFTHGWENFGSTPAHDVMMHISWDTYSSFNGDLPPGFDFVDIGSQGSGGRLIGPKGKVLTEHLQIESNILEAVQMGHVRLFMWGWLSYRDSFKNTPVRKTQFCLELNRVDGDPYVIPSKPDEKPTIFFNFRICERHNCADEGCNQEA
jgi:hypothetical protein